MGLKLIAAVGENGEIGYLNDLPWDNIAEDMLEFMRATMEDELIMGRGTWDSLGRHALPGRTMIVISRQPIKMRKGHFWYPNTEEAIRNHPNAWIIGGASLFSYGVAAADEMLISHVKGTYQADRWFPWWDKDLWEVEEVNEFDKFTQKRYVRK